MEFWKPPCNLDQRDNPSVSQCPLWKVDRLVGALSSKIARQIEDRLALSPQLTFSPLKKNVYIKYSELSIQMPWNNLWAMTHQSNVPWTGVVVYINAVHLGERSQQHYCSFSVGRWQKKERRKFIEKLKILLFFSLLLFFFSQIPAWMCRRARGMHQDEK